MDVLFSQSRSQVSRKCTVGSMSRTRREAHRFRTISPEYCRISEDSMLLHSSVIDIAAPSSLTIIY